MENDNQPTTEELQAQVASLAAEVETWKDRAKANASAADELPALRDQLTAAQQQLADSAASTAASVRDALIKAHGLGDEAALITATDLDGVTAQIDSVLALKAPARPAPSAPMEGTRPTTRRPSTRGEFMSELLDGDDRF